VEGEFPYVRLYKQLQNDLPHPFVGAFAADQFGESTDFRKKLTADEVTKHGSLVEAKTRTSRPRESGSEFVHLNGYRPRTAPRRARRTEGKDGGVRGAANRLSRCDLVMPSSASETVFLPLR
jgi:hypothetical protein